MNFNQDLIKDRRNATESAGVPYDPESLLTGAEIERGLGYYDKRVFGSDWAREKACSGEYPLEAIPETLGPRIKDTSYDGIMRAIAEDDEPPSLESEESGYLAQVQAWIAGLA